MISFDQVSKRYSTGSLALDNVSFKVDRGEMIFVTGHSGAGKSTLLKLLMRIELPSRGVVEVAGQNLNDLPLHRLPYYRRHVGVVFQDHNLLFDQTIFENVALPLRVSGADEREVGRRVRASLDKVGLLSKESSLPLELSGGEQQRVGIARAVVNKPALLLADEPTGNLDPAMSSEIMQLFADFNQVGVTVLIVSHDLALINAMSYPVFELRSGQLLRREAE